VLVLFVRGEYFEFVFCGGFVGDVGVFIYLFGGLMVWRCV